MLRKQIFGKFLSHFETDTTVLIPMIWFSNVTIYASLLGKIYYLNLIIMNCG